MTETKGSVSASSWVQTVVKWCSQDALVQRLLSTKGIASDDKKAQEKVLCDRARLWLRVCHYIAECKQMSSDEWWSTMTFLYVPENSKTGIEYTSPLFKAMLHSCQFACTVAKNSRAPLEWLQRACAICNDTIRAYERVHRTWTAHPDWQPKSAWPVAWNLEYVTVLAHLLRARTQTALFLHAESADVELAMGAWVHFDRYNQKRSQVNQLLKAVGPLCSDQAHRKQTDALSDAHMFLMYTTLARRLAAEHKVKTYACAACSLLWQITQSDFCYRKLKEHVDMTAADRHFWKMESVELKALSQEHELLLRDNKTIYQEPVDQVLSLSALPHKDVVSGLSSESDGK